MVGIQDSATLLFDEVDGMPVFPSRHKGRATEIAHRLETNRNYRVCEKVPSCFHCSLTFLDVLMTPTLGATSVYLKRVAWSLTPHRHPREAGILPSSAPVAVQKRPYK